MFDVLPWSVAMPLVVKRLTCSIERMPSRTASLMSLAVTSFWKSTKAFTVVSAPAPGAAPTMPPDQLSDVSALILAPLPDLPPASFAAFSPAANASAIVSARPSVPFDAPTETQSCAYWPGRKRLVASSKATLPRDCENMCTDGVQPADIRIASTGIVRSGPPPLACTVIDDTRSLPPARMTARPWLISMPSPRASSTAGPVGLSLMSTIAATLTPAFFRSIAAA